MIKNFLSVILTFFVMSIGWAQDLSSDLFAITDDLKENANSIIQKEVVNVEITATDNMLYSSERVITVLNKSGNRHVNAVAYYDNSTKVKKMEAVIYDSKGMELESFKKRDMIDASAVEGGTLFSDSRKLYLDYSPTEYPFTVVFKVVYSTDNTAFIPYYGPYTGYHNSVSYSTYSVSSEPALQLKFKEFNIDDRFEQSFSDNTYTIKAKDLKAIEPEDHAPNFDEFTPKVIFALNHFGLEGVDGYSNDWQQFGKWMNSSLLQGVNQLSAARKNEIKALVADYPTTREKAKVLYEYMQAKTRYISVQIGIGGWRPMKAIEVDDLGYGDCKALTNYTKTLFDIAEIPSYYTIVHANRNKKNILPDFPSMQGNHVILAVPNEGDMIWLECTSQEVPFGYIGTSTDDRDVFMVTPDGGEIVHTKKYEVLENELLTMGTVSLLEDGSINAQVNLKSRGTQYGQRFGITTETKKDQLDYYKSYWDYVDNLKFGDIAFDNNKDQIIFEENIDFTAIDYAQAAGNDIIVPVNILNRNTYLPERYKDRQRELKISRGFIDKDEVTIKIPLSLNIQFIPEAETLDTPYGTYSSSIEKISDHELIYKRTFSIKPGLFEAEDYKKYRSFRRKVTRLDNQKLILTK